jgi:hypothetical protein
VEEEEPSLERKEWRGVVGEAEKRRKTCWGRRT